MGYKDEFSCDILFIHVFSKFLDCDEISGTDGPKSADPFKLTLVEINIWKISSEKNLHSFIGWELEFDNFVEAPYYAWFCQFCMITRRDYKAIVFLKIDHE